MALLKSRALPSGFTAEYWRVSKVSIDFISRLASLEMVLYKDKESRDGGMSAVEARYYDVPSSDFPFSLEELNQKNPIQIAYEKIKTYPEFLEARDA